MSALLRETGRTLSESDIAMLQEAHREEYLAQADSVRPLPGSAELLASLTDRKVAWAIATSGYLATAHHALAMLGLPEDAPMVTRDMVAHANPDPDLFPRRSGGHARHRAPARLRGRGQRQGPARGQAGAGAIGIGVMSGGYGREELERAGAYRVYADPADLLALADEVGVRSLALPEPTAR